MVNENLDLLCALLDSLRSEGVYWYVDDSEQVITFNDINDGAREVYRIYKNPDGTAWSRSE